MITAAFFFAYQRFFNHNFAVVEAGKLYRSAQLNGDHLQVTLKKFNIRTVLNLRGKNDNSDWYHDEVSTCSRMGVKHIDLALSAKSLPSPKDLMRLVKIFQESSYPILVHCRSGSDRTGLAIGVYLITQKNEPFIEASEKSLHWRFQHIKAFGYQEMDELFTLFSPKEKKQSFAEWVKSDYPSIYEEEAIENGL